MRLKSTFQDCFESNSILIILPKFPESRSHGAALLPSVEAEVKQRYLYISSYIYIYIYDICMIPKKKQKRFIPVMSAVLGSEGLTPILKIRRPTTTATTGWIADDIERAKMA